jgi:hypothetical protein
MTFGGGRFWYPEMPRGLELTTLDIDPARRPDVVGDFRALPFADRSFDVAVFDPPYLTHPGRTSIICGRFGSFATQQELRDAVERGCREAWRTARLGAIVKVQDHLRGGKKVWMSDWAWRSVPVEPFDQLIVPSPSKIEDRRWGPQLSVRSTHACYWVWRKDGPTHKRRAS